LAASLRGEVDSIGNNIAVKELLLDVENKQLLSKVAASGLLSKAQKAGITLSSLEPLLDLAAGNPDILVSARTYYSFSACAWDDDVYSQMRYWIVFSYALDSPFFLI
jgi:hypothetical protein